MRIYLFLVASLSAYCADLIYLSNDTSPKNLQMLNSKYQQTFLLNDSDVYLIPSECQSERYFGGASEGVLNLINGSIRTEIVLNTQEIFDAKDEKDIVKKIELDKTFAIAQGKISKDFLEDKEGRGFGGASEVPVTISNEIESSTSEKPAIKQPKQEVKRPSCELLQDGSGYKITSLNNGRLYINGVFSSVVNNTVLFH